jgi:hypothetical protein
MRTRVVAGLDAASDAMKRSSLKAKFKVVKFDDTERTQEDLKELFDDEARAQQEAKKLSHDAFKKGQKERYMVLPAYVVKVKASDDEEDPDLDKDLEVEDAELTEQEDLEAEQGEDEDMDVQGDLAADADIPSLDDDMPSDIGGDGNLAADIAEIKESLRMLLDRMGGGAEVVGPAMPPVEVALVEARRKKMDVAKKLDMAKKKASKKKPLPKKKMKKLKASKSDFADGYISALVWSSSYGEHETLDDFRLSEEAKATLEEQADKFYADNADLLMRAEEEGRSEEYLGHDFALTRNGHGAGFWDGRIQDKELAKALTDAAHKAGEVDLYLGDDDLIYVA